jgi:hypothetical protein
MTENGPAAKLQVYRTLYRMNLSFANIVAHCQALGKFGTLSPKFSRLYQCYTQELRAEINQEVVEAMNELELGDMARFGKARIAREKELRDPDDVFIHAEERRKELARQHKRSGTAKKIKKKQV